MYEMPPRLDPLEPRFVVAALLVVLVTAGLVALRRRWPAGLAAWTYSALMILPLSGAALPIVFGIAVFLGRGE